MSIPWQFVPAFQPCPAEGVYFRRRSFEYFERVPLGHNAMYGASWFDIKTDDQVGSMCHCVIEMDRNRRFHLIEMWHARTDIDSAIQAMFQIQEGLHTVQLWQDPAPHRGVTYGPKMWFLEPDQFEAGLGDRINLRKVRINERVENPRDRFRIATGPLNVKISIEEAARSLQADLSTRTFLLPKTASFRGALEAELTTWPASPTASRVAALGLISAARMMIHPAHARPNPAGSASNVSWLAH